MAHTKAAGGAKRNVDVAGKRLGLKKFGGEYVKAGNIVLRQRGTVFYPGLNTGIGRDHTIFATAAGFVAFRQMTGKRRTHKAVDVMPTTSHVIQIAATTPKKVYVEVAETEKAVKAPKASKTDAKAVAPKASKVVAEKPATKEKPVEEAKTAKPAAKKAVKAAK